MQDGLNFIIEGGTPLTGSVETSRSKNGDVALLAASLLNSGTTTLRRVPKIEEVNRLVEVLCSIGVSVEWLLQDRLPDFIAEGIDCAVHIGPVDAPGLVAIRLADLPRIVVSAPGLWGEGPAPQSPAELATLPWLALTMFYRDQVTLVPTQGGEPCQIADLAGDAAFALSARAAARLHPADARTPAEGAGGAPAGLSPRLSPPSSKGPPSGRSPAPTHAPAPTRPRAG